MARITLVFSLFMALVLCIVSSHSHPGFSRIASIRDEGKNGSALPHCSRLRGGDSSVVDRSPALPARGSGTHEPEGDMSVRSAILNLIADLCPHGMLPLAYGMAAGGGTGVFSAPLLLLLFGIASVYSMVSLGRACEETKCYTLAGVWSEIVGVETAWLLELCVVVLTFGCCVFYSAFIGDLFSSLVQTLPRLPSVMNQRWVNLVLLSIFPVLPLCLMKNLSALQYTSFGGLISIFYTVFFVVKRSLDGSYSSGGQFFGLIPLKSQNPTENFLKGSGPWSICAGTLTLMNMACVAFMAHYNGVKYYEELEDRSVSKYAIVLSTGMGVAFIVFSTMMIFGFKTFGASTQALLLNNYHHTADKLANWARLATGLAIICGYPLMFSAFKGSFFPLSTQLLEKFALTQQLGRSLKESESTRKAVSSLALGLIVFIACHQSEEDLGTVVGLIGALLGSAAAYIFPGLLNIGLLTDKGKQANFFRCELPLNFLLVASGVVFMILGTWQTLLETGGH